MKKIITIIAVAVMMIGLTATLSFAVATGLGLSDANSPHNFSAAGWNSTGEICVVCHVPHDHDGTLYTNGLLWNHEVTAQTFVPYASPTLSQTLGQPSGHSKLCLSCHDGTVALDDFGGTTTGTATVGLQVPGTAAGNSLQGTHPISIDYDIAAAADQELLPSTAPMPGSGTIGDVLEGTLMQCSACHDVHDGTEVAVGTELLRVPNSSNTPGGGTASGLCLVCHLK